MENNEFKSQTENSLQRLSIYVRLRLKARMYQFKQNLIKW